LTAPSPKAEQARLAASARHDAPWRLWGPYLAERQWGTVREDYSPGGDAWSYFPFEQAHTRAYRWGEDGIAGMSDLACQLCLSLAMWNGRDPILKERLFGLTNGQGNHGEDVKEQYFYLDATPTASYLKMLYKYPQREFPYARLREENARRSRNETEFELLDTGIFDDDRYWDVFVEYAKADADDLLMFVSVHNRGPDVATIHLLPQLWFRNTWSWNGDGSHKPRWSAAPASLAPSVSEGKSGTSPASASGSELRDYVSAMAEHSELGPYELHAAGSPALLFCENETNLRHAFQSGGQTGYRKDAFHDYLIRGDASAVNPQREGTKVAAHYELTVAGGQAAQIRVRLTAHSSSIAGSKPASGEGGSTVHSNAPGAGLLPAKRELGLVPSKRDASPFADFDAIFAARRREADEFYAGLQSTIDDADARLVQRQALAGLVWTKQFYYYDVPQWLAGDPAQPKPPPSRLHGRNSTWEHLSNADILSMPDKWEYPWYAAWDLAFHCLPLAMIDPEFAKHQLVLLAREWYMHPSGQLPAYEWNFSDVNPPVHAWATWRVFQMDRKRRHETNRHDPGDLAFLERVFHKLMLNFTWWVNRKDAAGRNIFQGGFLGLDNIGVFDRSSPLPTGGYVNQADGTSWMAMYCLNLMRIALELSLHNPVYEDIATKFFEHFLHIAEAMTNIGGDGRGVGLWDDEDKFYYDELILPDGRMHKLKVRSMVGLIPLFAVETIEPELLERLPEFARRLTWYLEHRPDLASLVSRWHEPGRGDRRLLSLLRGHRMKKLLARMLDETEFLSDYGVRALSQRHEREPYVFPCQGMNHEVAYEPGESRSNLFGGNSNWRGPIWFPVNYLLVESLQRFHHYHGDAFTVECPTGSGRMRTLWEVAAELSRRLSKPFLLDADGRRPVNGGEVAYEGEHWRDLVLFYEYLHGDTAAGLGASHQTGWTALVAKLLQQNGE
jgi:hypothetical protein